MSKHTPGPWVVKADEEIVYGTSPEGEHIVVVYELNTNEADAALIAAAPDLLMALHMLSDETADYIRLNNLGGMDNQCMQLARAALARAVGAA